MTDSSLIERITRSLAFMLRHQPEQFELELDAQGWADLGEVVRALNERLGEPVDEDDVRAAVQAGDRARYEIGADRIRALYGHSIPVEPGPASKPPEFLHVAIPAQDVDRARRYGLRGGRRRFLHLALSEADAAEGGRRSSRDYTVLTIRALEAWEEGVNFYDRQSLWLAEEVPTQFLQVGETHHDGREPYADHHREGRRGGRGLRGHHRRGRHEGHAHHHGHEHHEGEPEAREPLKRSEVAADSAGESLVPSLNEVEAEALQGEPCFEPGEPRQHVPGGQGGYGGRGERGGEGGGRRRRRRGRGRGRGRDRDQDRDRPFDREPVREGMRASENRHGGGEPSRERGRHDRGHEGRDRERKRDQDRGPRHGDDRDGPPRERREPAPLSRDIRRGPQPDPAREDSSFGAGLFSEEHAAPPREPRPARRPEPPPPPAPAETGGGSDVPFGAGI